MQNGVILTKHQCYILVFVHIFVEQPTIKFYVNGDGQNFGCIV